MTTEVATACVRSRYLAEVVRFAESLPVRGAPAPENAYPARTCWPPDVRTGADLAGPWPKAREPDAADAALLHAAERALVRYPGPVGELIRRELHAHVEFGHRFGGGSLVAQLAAHLLADDG